jgi:hypothetical protein
VPHLCEFYPGICRTTEEKARKNPNEKARRGLKRPASGLLFTLKIETAHFSKMSVNIHQLAWCQITEDLS